MANVNFGTFTTVTPQGNDYFVGYRNTSETKTLISSLTSLNLPYVYTTDTLRSNSARYENTFTSVYTVISPNTGNWNSTYSTVQGFSGVWSQQPDLSLIQTTSSNWNEAYFQSVPDVSILRGKMTLIQNTSGFWDAATLAVFTNYLSWNNAASGYSSMAQVMNPLSAKWTSVYNNVNANSATYVLTQGNTNGTNIIIGALDDFTVSLIANNNIGLTVLSAGRVQEGSGTAQGSFSHAEGVNTLASGNDSHAQNFNTIAAGFASHAEGGNTVAAKQYSHAGGYYVQAAHDRTWAWRGDSTATDLISTTRSDQYMVSAAGGVFIPGNVGIGTDNNTNALTVNGVISAAAVVIGGNNITNVNVVSTDNTTITIDGSNYTTYLNRVLHVRSVANTRINFESSLPAGFNTMVLNESTSNVTLTSTTANTYLSFGSVLSGQQGTRQLYSSATVYKYGNSVYAVGALV